MSKYTIEQFSQITGLNKILIRTWENRYSFVEDLLKKNRVKNNSFQKNKYKFKELKSKQVGKYKDGFLTFSKKDMQKL